VNIQRKYIVIEGNIGAGKTTLVTKISEQFGGKPIFEQFHDNPFLPKFYKNPERYSFTLELSFLAARYKQLNAEITSTDLFASFTIADYYFVKSLIFAKATLQLDEYNLYRTLFNIIYKQLPVPDIYVYLHKPVEQLLQNIAKRNRDYEKSITADYLKSIQQNYFDFFKTETQFPIVIIDTTNIDFVNNKNHYNKILEILFKRKFNKGINRILLNFL
jgi:deoxyadenosine/deoxycytidine kinase